MQDRSLIGTKKTSGWKLTEAQKAEIVARIANGEHGSKLAQEYGVTQASISSLVRKRQITVDSIKEDLQDRKHRIIEKGLVVIERKLNNALKNGNKATKSLEGLRIDHISKLVNDMWKQSQVESGKPTSIEQKNSLELKLSIDKKYQEIQGNDVDVLEGIE